MAVAVFLIWFCIFRGSSDDSASVWDEDEEEEEQGEEEAKGGGGQFTICETKYSTHSTMASQELGLGQQQQQQEELSFDE